MEIIAHSLMNSSNYNVESNILQSFSKIRDNLTTVPHTFCRAHESVEPICIQPYSFKLLKAWAEFELAYDDVVVQHVNDCPTRTYP